MTKTLKIEGMMCPRCEAHVTKALLAVDGVIEAHANHETGQATVTLSHDVNDATLAAAVEAEDYRGL